jgi:hypothetical protein
MKYHDQLLSMSLPQQSLMVMHDCIRVDSILIVTMILTLKVMRLKFVNKFENEKEFIFALFIHFG